MGRWLLALRQNVFLAASAGAAWVAFGPAVGLSIAWSLITRRSGDASTHDARGSIP
jgi:hypothetical protein